MKHWRRKKDIATESTNKLKCVTVEIKLPEAKRAKIVQMAKDETQTVNHEIEKWKSPVK